MDSNVSKFIGKGLIFPIEINQLGRAVIKEDHLLIESSIKTIFSYFTGTRFMLGEFGSKLETLLEEPNDKLRRKLVKYYTVDTLSKWETRIEILDVTLTGEETTRIFISIKYRIKNTKSENTFVFPYYSQINY